MADTAGKIESCILHKCGSRTTVAKQRRRFLIRGQPYYDSTGKVLRWYSSMMDVDEWVIARQDAERRRQSMLTLFAGSDVMLWGVDKYGHVYLQEGGLHWNPVGMIEPAGITPQEQAPRFDFTDKKPEDHDGRERLRLALRTILHGPGSHPIVEHREGQRYFRTMFVAERTASTSSTPSGEETGTKPAVRAALALTFEITDERNQAMLLLENEKLIANEKAANEANELKSRFLANVSKFDNSNTTGGLIQPCRCLTRFVPPYQAL